MPNNGLTGFAFHRHDDANNDLHSINESIKSRHYNVEHKGSLNPEVVAKTYLDSSLAEQSFPFNEFNVPGATENTGDRNVKFEVLKTEYLPLTGNKIVKFRQRVNGISIYGSTANVELDENNELVSINSSLAANLPALKTAAISPLQAKKNAAGYLGTDIPGEITPLLYYYFINEEWRFVYMLQNIPVNPAAIDTEPHEDGHFHEPPSLVNVVVDAMNGEVLEVTPAMINFKSQSSGLDENGQMRDFFVLEQAGKRIMADEDLNVYTYDNGFNTYIDVSFPGNIVAEATSGWPRAAVSAHVNAGIVVSFLRDVLKRNSIDGAGLKILSSIHCTQNSATKEWFNAVWLGSQKKMAYGQVSVAGRLKSLSACLDVVAHEIMHGVTQHTARLEYHNQSGALNESFSDIFGVLISNLSNPDINTWNWELGEDVDGRPIRNVRQPSLFDQPEHMNNYRNLPDTYPGDWGGVHINSGIHNKASFVLLTSRNPSGGFIFTPAEVAQLYYLALIQLSEKSLFTDSYRCIINAAKSKFNNDPAIAQKLAAIDAAFSSVGIR